MAADLFFFFFFNIFYFHEIMTHMQYMMMMMKVQADYGYIKKKSHRKQQIHLHTRDLEQMLIRGRSPAIIGGSTSNQHRPNSHVPAGSKINRPPPERTRRTKPPSTPCWASVVGDGPTLTQERLDASRWPGSQC